MLVGGLLQPLILAPILLGLACRKGAACAVAECLGSSRTPATSWSGLQGFGVRGQRPQEWLGRVMVNVYVRGAWLRRLFYG